MVQCSQCGRDFDMLAGEGAVASIAGSIMGDEYIESYYLCPRCGFYTVEIVRDRFLGEAEILVRGPIPRSEGDAMVNLIRQCSEPGNKSCRCNAHQEYFSKALD